MKEYGKQRFYLSRQEQYETPSPDEAKVIDAEIATKEEARQRINDRARVLQVREVKAACCVLSTGPAREWHSACCRRPPAQAECATSEQELSDEELVAKLVQYEIEVQPLEERLQKLKTAGTTIDQADITRSPVLQSKQD